MSHQAIIAKLDSVKEIPSAKTIQLGFVLGTQVVISKDLQPGYIGVLFPTELELSKKYLSENNLYRHSELNNDNKKVGFFESSGRVRSQPFMKQKSDGYFTSIESLKCFGDISNLKLGDMLSTLYGETVCTKYISKKAREQMERNRIKKPKSIQAPSFLPHVESDQFKYYAESIPEGVLISIFAKYHGTSGRYSYSKVSRELPIWKKIVNKIYPTFSNENYEYLCGTRRVVLFEDHKEKVGFHGAEQFRFDVLEQLKPHLTKNMIVYGELVGWANNSTIMPRHNTESLKNKQFTNKYGKDIIYKYGCVEGQTKFLIYRISLSDGENTIDFSPAQIKDWCEKRGFEYVKQIHPTFIYNGNPTDLRNLVEHLTEREDLLTEDYIDPSHPSEGIVIRVDGHQMVPLFFKNKSFCFKVMEGIAKENEIDLEDVS